MRCNNIKYLKIAIIIMINKKIIFENIAEQARTHNL